MADPVRVLLVTGGHPFEREPFLAVFADNPDVAFRHADQPIVLSPTVCADVDVVVLYDMPGIEFTGADPPVRLIEPPPDVVDGWAGLLDAGVPVVALHHAIAGWPAWHGYGEMLGGRFHYQAARFAGTDWPDSGYCFEITHEVAVVAPHHPVCAGLDASFTISDELYLFPVAEDAVTPLLRSTARFTDDGFFSADLAVRGRRNDREGWAHPPGSDLVAWTKQAGNSTVVYVQFGDGPQTYADPNYRRVVANAVAWAATTSPSARTARPGAGSPA